MVQSTPSSTRARHLTNDSTYRAIVASPQLKWERFLRSTGSQAFGREASNTTSDFWTLVVVAQRHVTDRRSVRGIARAFLGMLVGTLNDDLNECSDYNLPQFNTPMVRGSLMGGDANCGCHITPPNDYPQTTTRRWSALSTLNNGDTRFWTPLATTSPI